MDNDQNQLQKLKEQAEKEAQAKVESVEWQVDPETGKEFREAAGGSGDDGARYNYFMAVVFPDNQLKILQTIYFCVKSLMLTWLRSVRLFLLKILL